MTQNGCQDGGKFHLGTAVLKSRKPSTFLYSYSQPHCIKIKTYS